MSLHCVDCTILLAEYNKRIRLEVKCPNLTCNVPIKREAGCDVINCPQCNIQFCYGCEYIFNSPPNYEWNWTCSCLINNLHPKQYNDKEQSMCEEKYIEFQERRGIIIQPLLPPQLPEVAILPVVPILIEVPEVNVDVPPPQIEQVQRVFDNEDILHQIQLALQMGDDFSNLY